MTDIPDKRLFRPNELAEILDKPVRTIYYWLEMDKIKHVHLGSQAKIPREEVERILREGI